VRLVAEFLNLLEHRGFLALGDVGLQDDNHNFASGSLALSEKPQG
jgi:hypothetical protein